MHQRAYVEIWSAWINAYKHVLSVHYLFADGHAVRVGCYDAFAKKLQLVGKGNLWPGNRVRKNLNFI